MNIAIVGTGYVGLVSEACFSEMGIDVTCVGMIRMMSTHDDFIGPVNLGNPGEFTMLELAEKIIELINSKSEIIYCSLPGDDPKQRKPDITLTKEKLDWQPAIRLEEGLVKTIEYFKTK